MHRRTLLTRIAAAGSAGALGSLAGCTYLEQYAGDDGAATTEADMAAETETMDAATVSVASTDEYGDILVDSEGMTLYLFTQDEGGESVCYDDCADNWPPLIVDDEPTAGEGVTADLGTTEREDGSLQVTAAGHPLYYFAGDSEPGDTNGQGVGDVWYVLAPDGSQIGGQTETETETETTEAVTVAVASTDEYGDILVDAEGMTLYLFTQDEGGESVCYDDCAENWPPLVVDGEPTAGDGVTAELGTSEREDGSMQVTAAGHPLYYFAADESPGDTNGQGVGDVWYVLAPDGSQIGGETETTADETETTESGGSDDPYY